VARIACVGVYCTLYQCTAAQVDEAQSAESALVRLESAGGVVGAHIDGSKGRVLRALVVGSAVRHLYATVWELLAGSTAGPHAVEMVLISLAAGARSSLNSASYSLSSSLPTVLVLTPGLGRPSLPVAEVALRLLSALVQAAPATAASASWLLTVGAQQLSYRPMKANPTTAGPWGLGRSSRTEAPTTRIGCVDVGSARGSQLQPAISICALACSAPAELEHSCTMAHAHVPRLAVAPPPLYINWVAGLPMCVSSGNAQLLTGGTGGLGLLTARWLAQQGAPILVLASRTGVLPVGGDGSSTAEVVRLRASAAQVLTERCDAADASETCQLISSALPMAVAGVWHAAGVLADGTLPHQDASSLRRVYSPKAHGAVTLQRTCATSALHSCTLFSSVAALLGGAGQANYAAANCCLDSHASWRRTSGTAGVSVQWGAWAEVGMAAGGAVHARLQTLGFGLVGLAEGLSALHAASSPASPSVLAVVPAQWDVILGSARVAPAFLSTVAPQLPCGRAAAGAVTAALPVHMWLEGVLDIVRRTAGGVVDADAPLLEAGVDSLGAVELRNQLQAAGGDSQFLPSTLVFDHPTARQLAELLRPVEGGEATHSAAVSLASGEACATTLLSCSTALPSAVSGLGPTWGMSSRGVDTLSAAPPSRWEVSDTVLAFAHSPAILHGGFLASAELLDHSCFGISPAEAAVMDPQQRLLLEHSFGALLAAGTPTQQLMGSLTGVFVGVWASEYAEVLRESPAGRSVYAATAATCSVVAGRVSFVLGLHGPCVSYDTACSSGLVACHSGRRVLQHGECTSEVVAGVNMIFSPSFCAIIALAGMTSPTGRSHSFDARADGYARGEACAAGVLSGETGSAAGAIDVCGSAVQSDGRSASLTSPNGQAQQGLLRAALTDATTLANNVAMSEAHGTGTALGDPIEVGALAGAVLSGRPASCSPVGVGGAKANIGHAEPAAGLTGLVQLAVGLMRCSASPNAQLRVLNLHLHSVMMRSSCVMPTQLATVGASGPELGSEQTVRGVSSFGYSGTIAHAVLRSHGTATDVQPTHFAGSNALFHRRSFPWSDPPHPLLQQRLPHSEGLVIFRSPTAGRLHALVSEHVVQGRVVFPGAAYLEAARAVWSASTSAAASLVGLHGVFFLQPLDVGSDSAAAFIDCVLSEDSAFEVRSGDEVALQGSDAPMHCTGTASASAPPQQLGSFATRRSGCALAGCVGAQYDAFHAVGLQYGPSYRLLREAWACEQRRGDGVWRGAVARLERRLGSHEVVVHPADLDSSIQLGQFSGRSNVAGKMLLPFAVDAALLQRGTVEQWAVRALALTPARAYVC
jgi:acyl transferase domain-containing protein